MSSLARLNFRAKRRDALAVDVVRAESFARNLLESPAGKSWMFPTEFMIKVARGAGTSLTAADLALDKLVASGEAEYLAGSGIRGTIS